MVKKNLGMMALASAAAIFASTSAQAATQTITLFPTATGAVGGFFSLPMTPSFSDEFDFAVPGSGVVTAGGINVQLKAADITFTSVFLNGVMGTVVNGAPGDGSISSFNFGSVATGGSPQVLIVNGTTTGGAGYGGVITFTAAVPEAASWAMMLVGLGLVGGVMRQRARVSRVTFA